MGFTQDVAGPFLQECASEVPTVPTQEAAQATQKEEIAPRYIEQFPDDTILQTTDYISFNVYLMCLLSMGLGVIAALYYWLNDQTVVSNK